MNLMCYTDTKEICTRDSGANPGPLFYVQNREVVTVAIDWLEIKSEYVNGNISLRKLAEKTDDITYSQLAKVAAAEKWSEARKNQRIKIESKQNQKIAEVIAKQGAKRVERLLSISDQFIDRIEQAVRELDQVQVTNKKKTKVIEYKNGERPDKPTKEIIEEKEEILAIASIVDRKGLQQIATALKTVWDITGENEAGKEGEIEEDGLLDALGANAQVLFDDGDDSDMLQKEKET